MPDRAGREIVGALPPTMDPSRIGALHAALLIGAIAAACRATGGQDPRFPTPEEEREAGERHLRRLFPELQAEGGEAITREAIEALVLRERDASAGAGAAIREAIDRGDLDRARDLLGKLLAERHVEQARELAAAGDAAGALAALDRAVALAPASPAILCARGELALGIAENEARPGEATRLRETALASFLEAVDRAGEEPADGGDDPRPEHLAAAWLGASRAARSLGRLDEAAGHAGRGLAIVQDHAAAADLAVPLRRALADATFEGYLARSASGEEPAALATRVDASRTALATLLGATPEDASTWARLSRLSQARSDPEEARGIAARGLAIAPDDAALLDRLDEAAREVGGPAAAIAAFEPFCRRHPDVAGAAWHLARARLDLAIADASEGSDPRPGLVAAEAGFARCRALDERRTDSAREHEARCRGALGRWLLERGDLEGARAAFLSMEDARKDSLLLEIDGAGTRGVDGLRRVARALVERSESGSIDDLEQAARILDLLHAVLPEDARLAAEAGHVGREAAVRIELSARALGPERSTEAEALLRRAREAMERAFRALAAAAALAPRDERVAAEAGEVLVRYLQREPDRARAYLETAVELGEARVAQLRARAEEPGLQESDSDERRMRLEDAQTLVGDACYYLGMLHLTLLEPPDPGTAREWIERSRRAGPDPRVEIDDLLDRCTAALAGRIDPRLRDEDRWATSPGSGRNP